VTGEGVGTQRTLTSADGTDAIVERLEMLDKVLIFILSAA